MTLDELISNDDFFLDFKEFNRETYAIYNSENYDLVASNIDIILDTFLKKAIDSDFIIASNTDPICSGNLLNMVNLKKMIMKNTKICVKTQIYDNLENVFFDSGNKLAFKTILISVPSSYTKNGIQFTWEKNTQDLVNMKIFKRKVVIPEKEFIKIKLRND